eukprot:SAG11_NODE_714_length_7634_cov_4.848706_3_plen_143_part_00
MCAHSLLDFVVVAGSLVCDVVLTSYAEGCGSSQTHCSYANHSSLNTFVDISAVERSSHGLIIVIIIYAVSHGDSTENLCGDDISESLHRLLHESDVRIAADCRPRVSNDITVEAQRSDDTMMITVPSSSTYSGGYIDTECLL